MGILSDLKMCARFAGGLRNFLRKPITLEQARADIQRRLAERENHFLRILERGVFGYSASPYLPLLKEAQCEMQDIRMMVGRHGIEHTLGILYESGVRISFEQFKGRQPLHHDGGTAFRARDFDNPYRREHYRTKSGGSTGTGTRVSHDLDHLAVQSSHLMLTLHVHDAFGLPMALWRGILPDGSGINNVLRTAHFGSIPQKWFSPVVSINPSLKYRIATYSTVAMSRIYGTPIPWPQMVPIKDSVVVARWAVESLRSHGACLILAPVSRALRVCLTAREEGWDLTGTTFMVAGEPPTPTKMREITRSGARYFPTYGLAESGRMGMGCGSPVECNDLHLLTDAFAVIQRPYEIPGSDMSVPAFAVTSLLPSTPKLMLNVEIDDYGVLEERSCGCPLEECGLKTHVRSIRNFRKLTGEGVTLVGSEMVKVLEHVLPARFGGTALDYQLLEEEDERGFTRLSLIIHPKISIENDAAVIDTVITALGKGSTGAESARTIWRQAGTLRVKRMEPVWTERGKYMPLHAVRNSDSSIYPAKGVKAAAAPSSGEQAPSKPPRSAVQ